MVSDQRVATVTGGSATRPSTLARGALSSVEGRNPPYVRVCLIPECFDANACNRMRAAMDHGTSESAEILDRTVTLNRQVRAASSIDVDRETLDLVENTLDRQRETIAAFFDIQLSGREGTGFLRYQAGGFYLPHRDRGDLPSWPGAARRQVSLVVFLNASREQPAPDEFSGGVLRLLEEERLDIVPQQGLLVAFPSNALHEVVPVVGGTRDVVVDWFYQ